MAISYNGLWKILIDNGMKKGDLKRRTGISSGTIAKMTNGEAVTLTRYVMNLIVILVIWLKLTLLKRKK